MQWLGAFRKQYDSTSGEHIILDVLGPAPAFHVRLRGKTRIHVLLKVSHKGFVTFSRALRAHMYSARLFVDPDSVL